VCCYDDCHYNQNGIFIAMLSIIMQRIAFNYYIAMLSVVMLIVIMFRIAFFIVMLCVVMQRIAFN
jgi:hypothetical protein